MPAIQTRTRTQIRESIGYALGEMMLVTASSTVDTSSLIAAYSLRKGGDDEYNGRQVVLVTKVGSIVLGEKSWISDFASATWDATVAPVFSASITSGDIFEMWRVLTYEEVNEAIDQAIIEVTDECLQVKEVHNVYTESGKYEYACLSGFKAVHKVEWVQSVGTEHQLHACDTAWEGMSVGDVTASVDTALKKEGSGSAKFVVAAGLESGSMIQGVAISSTDISDCDELEIWVYSTVALAAGDLQLLLDDTANYLFVAADETLNIPATTANTWTRHVISLANPQSDSAIIRLGLKMVVDKGAFSLWVDDGRAVKSGSRRYETLNAEHWGIVRGSTNYLKLTSEGLSTTGNPTQLRVNGYKLPALLTADTGESEIDPNFIIAFCVGQLLSNHAKSGQLDVEDRQGKSDRWLARAERIKRSIHFKPSANFRSF